MTTPVVIGGDDIVTALEAVLRANVPLVLDRLELAERLGEVKTWQIVPDTEAISAAEMPAIAIVAARTGEPAERTRDTYSGTWDVSVGVFDRGDDHADTQTRIQAWAKVIRVAGTLSRALPGTSIEMRWVGEAYDLLQDKSQARTIAGAEVMFDAHVSVALDLSGFRSFPLLETVHPTVNPTKETP
ncbi:hypothetical protein [Microbacterium sp. KNMS]